MTFNCSCDINKKKVKLQQAFLSVLIKKDTVFTLKGMKRINYVHSIDPAAYAYLVKALQLLQTHGYFMESIL